MKQAQDTSPTKEKLLEVALQLMQSKGFGATRVDEICAAAGVSKGSFFHYFSSKEDLGAALIERYTTTLYQLMQAGTFRKKRDPLQRIYGYVDFVSKTSQEPFLAQGCLLGNFGQELSTTHPTMRALCAQSFGLWVEALKQDLDEAKTQYAPKAMIDTRSLAEHFTAVFEGALMLAKVKQDPSVVETSLGHFKQYLKSLFGG